MSSQANRRRKNGVSRHNNTGGDNMANEKVASAKKRAEILNDIYKKNGHSALAVIEAFAKGVESGQIIASEKIKELEKQLAETKAG